MEFGISDRDYTQRLRAENTYTFAGANGPRDAARPGNRESGNFHQKKLLTFCVQTLFLTA